MTTDWSAYSELFCHYLVNLDFLKRYIPSELYSFVQLKIISLILYEEMRFTRFTIVLITPWWLIFPCACTLCLVSCLWKRISLSWWPQVHWKIHYHGMFQLIFSFLRRNPQPQKLREHLTTLLPWQFLCMYACHGSAASDDRLIRIIKRLWHLLRRTRSLLFRSTRYLHFVPRIRLIQLPKLKCKRQNAKYRSFVKNWTVMNSVFWIPPSIPFLLGINEMM